MPWDERRSSSPWHARRPRRSAFESFDEAQWLSGVREHLRTALVGPPPPASDMPWIRDNPRPLTLLSSDDEQEPEMKEDPRAKAHLSLTADAMEEVLALGGIVDQDDQGPVHLDGFAEQVWRVDTPSTSQAPSSLLSAFQRDTTGTVDFDALLQFRARMAQGTSPTPNIQVLDHDADPPDTLMQAEEDAPMDVPQSLPDSFLSHALRTEPMTQAPLPHPPSPILVLSDSDHESDHPEGVHPTHDRCVPHETRGALYEESDEDSDENDSEDGSEDEADESEEESEEEGGEESEEEGEKESEEEGGEESEEEGEKESEEERGEESEEVGEKEGGEESEEEGEEESEEEGEEESEEEGEEESEEEGGEESEEGEEESEEGGEESEEESGKDQHSQEAVDEKEEKEQDENLQEEPNRQSQEEEEKHQVGGNQDHPAAAPKDEADHVHDKEHIAANRSSHALIPKQDLAGSVNPSMLLSRTDTDLLATPTQHPMAPQSHGPYQRLTLSKHIGAPAFIVHSCSFDPHVLEEEGGELDHVLADGLDMAPLDPDTLPEPVLQSLRRIVGPSMLDDIYVMPSPRSEPAPDTIRKRPRRSSPTAPLQMRLRTPEERRPPRHYSPDL
ncbi:hypothetical protein MARU1_001697 [Malassezia arunalokei]|uniref:Uncharacterized protein n=1 Tax=Malassezia arunalokei TaxID=1514897 RepID=A0AAJ5YYU3_9BASI|nr:hypothetical protein MARU1_001697 [Malassezia arunalokei]